MNPHPSLPGLGTHCLIDLYDCQSPQLDDVEFLEQLLRKAAAAAQAEVIGALQHRFSPHGVSVVCLLAESHISLHTWPEQAMAAADIYTCGTGCQPLRAADTLIADLRPTQHFVSSFQRGSRTRFVEE